jgi:hypothetical protein
MPIGLNREFCWYHFPQNSSLKKGHSASTHFQHCEDTDIKVRYEPLKLQSSLYVPLGLTSKNSTFHPHSVFMYFVWISEQTAIIFLYNINWLVFITETESVYCAVRTGSSYVIHVNLTLQRLILTEYLKYSTESLTLFSV